MVERDPRVDPRPGDILSDGVVAVIIGRREGAEFFARRYHGAEPCPCGGDAVFRIELEDIRRSAARSSVVVLAMGVPR